MWDRIKRSLFRSLPLRINVVVLINARKNFNFTSPWQKYRRWFILNTFGNSLMLFCFHFADELVLLRRTAILKFDFYARYEIYFDKRIGPELYRSIYITRKWFAIYIYIYHVILSSLTTSLYVSLYYYYVGLFLRERRGFFSKRLRERV